jgi:hypothetical protein
MKMSYGRICGVIIACLVVGGCASTTSTSSTGSRPSTPVEEFSANFTNISNVGATGATPVTIRITRWTPDDEHVTLMRILSKDGNDSFTRELQRMKETGSIGVPQQLAYPLLYARQVPGPNGGRKIMLITDRPMTFQERVGSSVSRDYPLTWIEMTLDKEDRGEGYVVLAARLRLLGEILGVEDLSNQPARLTAIRRSR